MVELAIVFSLVNLLIKDGGYLKYLENRSKQPKKFFDSAEVVCGLPQRLGARAFVGTDRKVIPNT